MRKYVSDQFPKGPISKVNEEKLSLQLDSLTRIANNTYSKKYPRRYTNATSLGHDLEKLKVLTSTEAFKLLAKDTKYRKNLEKLEEE